MTRRAAIDGWYTIDEQPRLLGNRCCRCGTVFFPKIAIFCRNPDCDSDRFDEVSLSRHGVIWSFTDAQYQPPPPYIARHVPFEPFALAAVRLDDEGIVVLGQVADGFGIADLAVGQPVELVVEPLYDDGADEYVSYRWRPLGAPAAGGNAQ